MGLAGVMSQISIAPPTGDITIKTLSAPTGITIDSTTFAKLIGKAQAVVEGILIKLTAEAVIEMEGKLIQINGKTEPAILGKKFMDIFKDHQHTSSVGPTGPIMPSYAMNALNAMSKKVFLG
jgi:hypothetical protein